MYDVADDILSRRSTVHAGSVMLTADVESWTQPLMTDIVPRYHRPSVAWVTVVRFLPGLVSRSVFVVLNLL